MTFTTTPLVGNRVLVEGTDKNSIVGREVLDSSQWTELKARRGHDEAHVAFNDAVKEFYAPLTDAIDELNASHAKANDDDILKVVITEATEAVAAVREESVRLTRDSAVLRLLEAGQEDRLVWVGEHLEILSA